ncbi:MAG: FHA domain-containing protein [Myxococcota bacterium]
MGVLHELGGDRRRTIGTRFLIGRSQGCTLQLIDEHVSAEHASVYFRDSRWWVRDLGSTNGTFLDGRLLERGKVTQLTLGAELAFGGASDAPRWRLVDDARPAPRARPLVNAEPASDAAPDVDMVTGSEDLLVLPDDEIPLVIVTGLDGAWVAERSADGETFDVDDHDEIDVEGVRWVLELPPPARRASASTVEDRDRIARSIEALCLEIRHSKDEEFVEVTAEVGLERSTLPARAFHYLLLVLARARISDQERGLSQEEQGWVYADRLTEELNISRAKLNVDIFRARKQIADLRVLGAARIVERRPQTQQLRLGVKELRVSTL